MKKILLGALACVCTVGFTLGLAACGQADNGSAELPAVGQETVLNGSVLMIPEGFPADTLGEDGDVCFATENGDFFRKENGAWSLSSIEHYDILENDVLSVTFENGENGNYKMTTLAEGSSCDHAGLADAEPHVVYESFCIVPGIGVKYCDDCGSSFAVILPANPDNHKANEENFGKCEFCGLLEDGSSGFVVNTENVKNIQEVVDQLQDGDILHLEGQKSESDPETPSVMEFTAANPFSIGNNKKVTVDVKDVDVSFTSDSSSALSIGKGSTLNFTSESSEEGTPKINLDSATSKPAVSVSGKGAVMNVEGVEINCHNTKKSNGDKGNPSIAVTDGGELILGKGTVVNEKDGDTEIKNYNAYGLKASGNNSVIRIDGATINSEGRGAAVMAQNGAKIEFTSGEINVSTTDTSIGLCASGHATVEMTGGVINVTGDLTGGIQTKESRRNCAVAIGEVHGSCDESEFIVTGGVINLTPTAGRAYAIATEGATWTTVELSGDLVINVNAAEGAQAAAFAVSQGAVCAIYDNVAVEGWTAQTNKVAKPEDRNFFQWVDDWYNGDDTGYFASLSDFRTK